MKKMYIMRGLPGSGKSTTAKSLNAVVLSSDQWFTIEGVYYFDTTQLYAAHKWNQWRCQQIVLTGQDVVIDNTNTTFKEIEPYARLGFDNGYFVEVLEQTTEWAKDIEGLLAHGTHNVPSESLEKMLARYEAPEKIQHSLVTLQQKV